MEPARASAMVEEARRRAERIAAALGARARDDARDSGAGDANEIDLDARATTRETRGTGTAVGTLAMRARRANAGVAGLYRAVEATTTRAAREPPRAYVERRLEQASLRRQINCTNFDGNLSGCTATRDSGCGGAIVDRVVCVVLVVG